MTSYFKFVPDMAVGSEQRTAAFISGCEASHARGGGVWDDVFWKGVRYTKLNAPKNARGKVSSEYLFSDSYKDFSKACIWYMTTRRAKLNAEHLYMALRVLEQALTDVYGKSDAWRVDLAVLDQSVNVIRGAYSENSGYTVVSRILDIASFLADHHLADQDIKHWKSPIVRPARVSSGLGKDASISRNSKLPDDEALDAVAEVFSMNPQLPRDIIVTSFMAMAMCAPQRASEKAAN